MSTDLRAPLRVGSMFAGIGGIDLGLERTGGFETVWFAEIDSYASAVLRKHWPDVPNYGDVRNIDARAERVDLIAAGFPCQPVSLAGKGLAQEDPRWLWPEVARVVGLLRPSYVLLENVPGLRKRGLSIVIGDLAALGYDAEWQIVSAASVGAPHLRERFVIVAYPNSDSNGCKGLKERYSQAQAGSEVQQRNDADGLRDVEPRAETVADSGCISGAGRRAPGDLVSSARALEGECQEWERRGDASDDRGSPLANATGERLSPAMLQWKQTSERHAADSSWWAVEPDVGRVADGIPSRMDRLRSLGNAVVPQVAEAVGRLILESHLGITKERDAA